MIVIIWLSDASGIQLDDESHGLYHRDRLRLADFLRRVSANLYIYILLLSSMLISKVFSATKTLRTASHSR